MHNMQEAEFYFHLGLPKVASTYFQTQVFPKLKDVTYFPKHQFEQYRQLAPYAHPDKYLFSCEKDRDLPATVEDIVRIFPTARFILFFRRQDDWLLSRYKYHIRKHGYFSFQEFFDIDHDNGYWRQEDLWYQNKIRHIERVSKYKPLILTYDLFKSQPDQFIDYLLQYIGTSLHADVATDKTIKPAFREKQLIILRMFNKLYPYSEATTPYRLLNKVHYKYREFLLHTVAFSSLLLPTSFAKKQSLLTEQDVHNLERIRQFYADDWAFCRDYSFEQVSTQ